MQPLQPLQPLQQRPSAPIASVSETGSVLSSPGGRPTPVNFDFHRPDAKRDPHIVQVPTDVEVVVVAQMVECLATILNDLGSDPYNVAFTYSPEQPGLAL